jgi:hypothetical protein
VTEEGITGKKFCESKSWILHLDCIKPHLRASTTTKIHQDIPRIPVKRMRGRRGRKREGYEEMEETERRG